MVFGILWGVLTLPFRFWGLITATASMGVGIVYPTLESFKAIESKELGDDTQWLSYWVVVTSLLVLEKLAWPLLMWIPLYSVLRVLALSWLALPQFQGAKYAYMTIRPLLFVALDKSRQIPALEPYLRSYQKAFGSGKVGAAPAASATAPAPSEPEARSTATPEVVKRLAVDKVAEAVDQATEAAAVPEDHQVPMKTHAY